MRILGVDPGTAVCGFGVVDAARPPKLVCCGVLQTSPDRPLAERLKEIRDGLAALIAAHAPEVVAVESAFYAKNVRTTVVLSHARAAVLLAAADAGLPVHEYPPATVKKAVCGRGAALKPQVAYMVAQHLRLATPPAPADAADGVALALTHLFQLARPVAPVARARRPA
ncbi:MAG: crossover junction endodeoxyribonuclease RuvC [Gemmatimonadales bacterium]|nr:crossover junction endodeoxyribonuclease RuvC [Gemmatimonadales bacterium]